MTNKILDLIYDDTTDIPNYKNMFDSDEITVGKEPIECFDTFIQQYLNALIELTCFAADNYELYDTIHKISPSLLYLSRHIHELLLKRLVLEKCEKKVCNEIFKNAKHSLKTCFDAISFNVNDKNLISELSIYYTKIDAVDLSSDLFRYPYNEDFLNKYQNQSINSIEMILCSLYLFYKFAAYFDLPYVDDDYKKLDDIYAFHKDEYFIDGNWSKISYHIWSSNCQLDEPDYFAITESYVLSSRILSKLNLDNTILPILYLYRHSIELSAKEIAITPDDYLIEEINKDCQKIKKYLYGHELKKKLEPNTHEILEILAKDNNWDLNVLNAIEKYIVDLDTEDRYGDKFRYPVNKNLELYSYHKVPIYKYSNICNFIINTIRNSKCVVEDINDNIYYMLSEYYQ